MTAPSWANPAVPDRQDCVLRYVLERQARERPDDVYAEFEDGSSWTYAETLAYTRHAASGLASLGLARDDVLLVWLPNGPDFLKAWFGANYLGASIASPNIAYRGAVLQHMVSLIEPRLAVFHAGLLDRLAGLDLGVLDTIVECGTAPSDVPYAQPENVTLHAAGTVFSTPVNPSALEDPGIEPWDRQLILFTSGTTGPSKAAIVSYVHAQTVSLVTVEERVSGGDRYLLNMPMFHLSGTIPVLGMLLTGGTVLFSGPFKTDTFWDVVHTRRPTICGLLSATAVFVENLPPRPDDADNSLRWIFCTPLVRDPKAFSKRFGVNLATSYGMSELSAPIRTEPNPERFDSCGRVRAGYQARIVDDFDREIPIGEIGELIVRCDRPWAFSSGYWRDPAATAAAWRNGWFHTGDNFRRDEEGNYFFVDRKKDAIRRRGENISSYEVELEALKHPDIVEAAVIAAASEVEDEVMLVVKRREDSLVAANDLFDFMRPRMAHFMLPRYIRFVAEMPKTPSLRIQKYLLREQGVTDDTWDRVAAGIVVRRVGIP